MGRDEDGAPRLLLGVVPDQFGEASRLATHARFHPRDAAVEVPAARDGLHPEEAALRHHGRLLPRAIRRVVDQGGAPRALVDAGHHELVEPRVRVEHHAHPQVAEADHAIHARLVAIQVQRRWHGHDAALALAARHLQAPVLLGERVADEELAERVRAEAEQAAARRHQRELAHVDGQVRHRQLLPPASAGAVDRERAGQAVHEHGLARVAASGDFVREKQVLPLLAHAAEANQGRERQLGQNLLQQVLRQLLPQTRVQSHHVLLARVQIAA
ncbi:hypothetical protein Mapa_004999 [Marchantia paleacea]|nr:hypothetical protein Mapa_004999 [Marchantia paleacea]